MFLFAKSYPVWCSNESEKSDRYRIFRKKFTLKSDGRYFMDIAADSTYVVYINGKVVPCQQRADFPGDISGSRVEITGLVSAGENIIAVEVHYNGERFLTYRPGQPFLWLELHDGVETLLATDESWKWADSPDYQSDLNCKLTSQLGFVFCRDARKSTGFAALEFDDSAWKNAVKVAGSENWKKFLRETPYLYVPQLLELPPPEVTICQMGYLKREENDKTFAEMAFHDFLSPRRPREFFAEFDQSQLRDDMIRRSMRCIPDKLFSFKFAPLPENADGYYVICDTGRETVGFLDLDITAPDGAVIDICHGEHLDDGRVRSFVGGRNFADRLIARAGENRFVYRHRRVGGRYVELHITNCRNGEVSLRYAGILPLELPLPEAAEFHCEDRMLSVINKVSIDTLKLCMHEHYEDCPWREQGLYAYDSRNQILYGYHVWGNYQYARASLDLLGKSFDGVRYLELTAPGYTTLTIPVWSLAWIVELYEFYLYSGFTVTAENWLPQVDKIIDVALAEMVENFPGLYHSGSGSRIWNFSEWNGKLSSLKEHPPSPYNIYLCEALRAAAKLHAVFHHEQRAGFLNQKADELAAVIEKAFYSENKGFYTAIAGQDDEGYEHIQAIMLANEMVPESKQPQIVEHFGKGGLRGIDLSALYYLVSGLMKHGPAAREILTRLLRNIFEPVVLSGATSLWETRQGADDFGYAGSLCHGWSSVMPYFCGHCILGVTPVEAGFRHFEVKPYTAGLTHADGSVPTPLGMIEVSWQKKDDGLHVKVRHPEGMKCIPAEYEECPVAVWDIAPARS